MADADPKDKDVTDVARKEFEAARAKAAADSETQAAATSAGLYFTAEELAAPIVEMPQVIDGLLFRDEAHILAAESGNSKSTLTIDIAVDFVRGRPCLNHFEPATDDDRRRVLYVSSEDRRQAFLMMLQKVLADKKLSAEDRELVRQRVGFHDLAEQPTALHDFDRQSHTYFPSQTYLALEKLIAREQPAVVVLDPLGMFFGGPENDNNYAMVLMKHLRALAARQRCAILGLHHVSKDVARGGATDQYVGRGASAFSSNLRGFLQLRFAEQPTVSYRGAVWVTDLFTPEQIAESQAMFLFRHKYSYKKQMTWPMAVVREGYTFRMRPMTRQDATVAHASRLQEEEAMVARWIMDNVPSSGLTKNAIADRRSELPGKIARDKLRSALDRLEQKGLLEFHPTETVKGGPVIVGAQLPRVDPDEPF